MVFFPHHSDAGKRLKRKCKCSGWYNLYPLKEFFAQPEWYKAFNVNELQIRHIHRNFNTYHYLNWIFILILHTSPQGCGNSDQVYSWITLLIIWLIGKAFLVWVQLAWHCSAIETHPSLKQGGTQFDAITVWRLGVSVSTAMPAKDQTNTRVAKACGGRQGLGMVWYGPCAEDDA